MITFVYCVTFMIIDINLKHIRNINKKFGRKYRMLKYKNTEIHSKYTRFLMSKIA